jgi:hypothetical protein
MFGFPVSGVGLFFSAFLGARCGELFTAEDAEKRREYRKRAPESVRTPAAGLRRIFRGVGRRGRVNLLAV